MTIGEVWRRIGYFLQRERRLSEVDEEMRLHLELRERQLTVSGIGPAEAKWKARRLFGNSARLIERSREEWGGLQLEGLLQDGRYAARGLRRNPGTTAVVIATLSLTIGAAATIFGLLHSMFLQRLPLPEPRQLVAVNTMNNGRLQPVGERAYRMLMEGVERTPLAAYAFYPVRLGSGEASQEVWADFVSGNFTEVLGARPLLGRSLSTADEGAEAQVAVISEEIWNTLLSRDPSVLGRVMKVGDSEVTIVGVMPSSYTGIHFSRRFSIAIPYTAAASLTGHGYRDGGLYLVSRIQSGTSAEKVQEVLSRIYASCCHSRAVSGESARSDGSIFDAEPIEPVPSGPNEVRSSSTEPHVFLADASRGLTWSSSVNHRRDFLRVLLAVGGGVAILLLIACTNVGTLLLARAVTRQREFAVRLSLGISRARLIRMLVAESFLIAIAGGILGIAVAAVGTTLLVHNLPPGADRLSSILEWRPRPAVLAFTTLVLVICTLFFGLWPARQAWRTDLLTPLKGKWRDRGNSLGTLGSGLVVAQVALAVVLVWAAGLFMGTLRNLTSFEAESPISSRSILVDVIDPSETSFASLGKDRFAAGLVELVENAGAATKVAVMWDAPLVFEFSTSEKLRVALSGDSPDAGESVRWNGVTPGFFSVSGIGMHSGREFTPDDHAEAEPVAIVSQTFAKLFFGSRDPLGEMVFRQSEDDRSSRGIRIVGVARDGRFDDVRSDPTFMWYVPLAQYGDIPFNLQMIVRTEGDAAALTGDLEARLRAGIPGIHFRQVRTVASILENALARERLAATLGTIFALIALGIVGLGVYALVSHATVSRTREIGVRIALGARQHHAVWLVLRQTLATSAVGTALGTVIVLLLGGALQSQLFQIVPNSPVVIIGSVSILLVVAMIASLLPSMHAARVDPMVALQAD